MQVTPSDDLDRHDMEALARGEDGSLNALMRRHSARVHQYLLRSLNDEDDAADLAQETFVRIYQNRGRFDVNQKFTTWLYTIASNLVRDRFRWRARHPQVSLDAESEEGAETLKHSLPDSVAVPDQALQRAERAEVVQKAVSKLPEELRVPLVLAVYEGLSQVEIGAILGCSAKAVETRIYRARNQLREALSGLLPQI